MELSVKQSVTMMLTIISASTAFVCFGIYRETTSKSMQNSTAFYSQNVQSVNDSLLGKQFPIISAENQRITLNASYDPKGWVSITDAQDGNITSRVQVFGKVDATTKGDYEIRYSVRNSFGLKTEKKIRVIVD